MYECRKCGAEFEESLHGTCPACGASSRHLRKTSGRTPTSVRGGVLEEKPKPKPTSGAPRPRVSDSTRSDDSYSTPGVFGPPKHAGDAASSSGVFGPPRHAGGAKGGFKPSGCGLPVVMLVFAATLLGGIGLTLFFVIDDCDWDSTSGSYSTSISAEEPLWRDVRGEMLEAGYEAVAGVDPEFWPLKGYTLWFVDDDRDTLWYNVFWEPHAYKVEFAPEPDLLGDIFPLADGGGLIAVLDYAGEYGLFSVSTEGETELLASARSIATALSELRFMSDDFYSGVASALDSRRLLSEPRSNHDGSFIAVAAGPVDDTRVVIVPRGGEPYVLDRYSDDTIPAVFIDGLLYTVKRHGDSYLLRSYDLTKDGYDFISMGYFEGGFASDGLAAAYASEEGGRPAVRFDSLGSILRESFNADVWVLPEGRARSISVVEGRVLCVLTRYSGQDGFLFRSTNLHDGNYLPFYYDLSTSLRSGWVGPPLR